MSSPSVCMCNFNPFSVMASREAGLSAQAVESDSDTDDSALGSSASVSRSASVQEHDEKLTNQAVHYVQQGSKSASKEKPSRPQSNKNITRPSRSSGSSSGKRSDGGSEKSSHTKSSKDSKDKVSGVKKQQTGQSDESSTGDVAFNLTDPEDLMRKLSSVAFQFFCENSWKLP